MGGAQFRVGGHGFQMPHHRHREVQRFGQVVEDRHRVLPRARLSAGGECVEALPGLRQQPPHGGAHVRGADAVERDAELDVQQGVGIVWHRREQY